MIEVIQVRAVVVHDESRLEASFQKLLPPPKPSPQPIQFKFQAQALAGSQFTRLMLPPLVPDSGRAVDEEVFLAQLRRRARLLDDGFQASMGQADRELCY